MKLEHKIITTMLEHPEKDWWYAPDFMQPGPLFVGYEASSRMSDMARKYPEMIEARKGDGVMYASKYRLIRIRRENINAFWSTIPQDFVEVFEKNDVRPEAITI